jgi:anti-anti-sigma factor
VWIVRAVGEQDIATRPHVEQPLAKLTSNRASAVVFDLGDATFIDTSVIGAIVRAGNGDGRENGHIAVVAPRGTFPRRVLNLVGAGSLFGVFETRDEALTHVRERLTA